MTVLVYLIPGALLLGAIWLATFLWTLNDGQYEDLDGAALRVLDDSDIESPNIPRPPDKPRAGPAIKRRTPSFPQDRNFDG